MPTTYKAPEYPYVTPPELQAGGVAKTQVAIVGAGPVGLAAAIDLAQQGIAFIIVDDNNTVSVGSRAICYAKRALEVLDRLGCGESIVARGVSWKVGKVYFRDRLAYQFDLLPEPGHKRPAFVNLQQYLLEEALVERLAALGHTVRWRNKAAGIEQDAAGTRLRVETPDGVYTVEAEYVIAADGARSPLRDLMGLEWKGQVFRDRFLIADVHMKAEFPTERWFWFDPPFHPGQSALLHRQADDVWRIDFQLGWDADPEEEKKPERVVPRIRAMLGDRRPFELEWVSVYTFQCRRLDRFVHGRVIFAGDAAHQVSPFGARGANSGFQDTDNLCWKLARVLRGQSPASLLDSYDRERVEAADENILNSTRATDFITPKSAMSRTFRDAVLSLSQRHTFARRLVNSGRLSTPTTYRGSALSTLDRDAFAGAMLPGAPAADAPVRIDGRAGWLLDHLGGHFELLVFAPVAPTWLDDMGRSLAGEVRVNLVVARADGAAAGVRVIEDTEGLMRARYDGQPGTVYLLRPDQHVAARWRSPRRVEVLEGVVRAQGRGGH
ncbi:MAG TPA: FAD-dependent oxidoreductase [Burkholderiaceae bacterium]|nr:FAD-dependent oxidoreductase [Burkholderiaceae bacterium]HQR72497.1 FAD-dependent oxidoreductase [Burkholderiaceae bacterium]